MIRCIADDAVFGLTASADTRIQVALGGLFDYITNIVNFSYKPGLTTHTITLMRGQTRARLTSAIAASGTTFKTDVALAKSTAAAPANSGLVGIQLDNQTWFLGTLSSPSLGVASYTLNSGIPSTRTAIIGARVVYFGLAADVWHANYVFAAALQSANTAFIQPVPTAGQNADVVLCRAPVGGEPIVLDSDNATNAGTLTSANVGYTQY